MERLGFCLWNQYDISISKTDPPYLLRGNCRPPVYSAVDFPLSVRDRDPTSRHSSCWGCNGNFSSHPGPCACCSGYSVHHVDFDGSILSPISRCTYESTKVSS